MTPRTFRCITISFDIIPFHLAIETQLLFICALIRPLVYRISVNVCKYLLVDPLNVVCFLVFRFDRLALY